MSDPRPYKRKILLVKKSLQYKFIALVVAVVVVGVGIIAADMFTALGRYLAESGGDVAGVYENTKFAFMVKMTVYLGGVLLLALIVSHKIAGPVYRFEISAEEVARGNLTSRVFLREGDELLELRESFNAMVKSLHDKASEDVSHADRVRRLLEEALKDGSLPSGAAQKLKEALAEAQGIGRSFQL